MVALFRLNPAGHARADGPPLPPPTGWAEIRVIDAETRRGVPLVELETVDRATFVTDNAGRVAFREPGLMGRDMFLAGGRTGTR